MYRNAGEEGLDCGCGGGDGVVGFSVDGPVWPGRVEEDQVEVLVGEFVAIG